MLIITDVYCVFLGDASMGSRNMPQWITLFMIVIIKQNCINIVSFFYTAYMAHDTLSLYNICIHFTIDLPKGAPTRLSTQPNLNT